MSEETYKGKERRKVDVGPYHRDLLKRMLFAKNQFGPGKIADSVWGAKDYYNLGNPDFASYLIGRTREDIGVIYGQSIIDWYDLMLKEKQRQAEVLADAVQFNQFFYGNQFAKIIDQELEKEIKRRIRVRKTDNIKVRPAEVNKLKIGYFLIVAENKKKMGTVFFNDEVLSRKDNIYEEVRAICEQAIEKGDIILLPEEQIAHSEYLARNKEQRREQENVGFAILKRILLHP
ncbi:MAG: hypothetical protein WC806_04145 [Candidatus Gracilibacteria bacterium]